MKLIKPKFEIIEQQAGLEGMYKNIELAGRVSHKSEDRITEDSAKKFVDNMIKLGHGATLEFGTVYLYFPIDYSEKSLYHKAEEYDKNPYSEVRIAYEEDGHPKHKDMGYYITTNLRVLVENGWLDDLKYLCEPTEYHEKRYCVKFTCDRGVSHEFVRHRVMSFLQESTRYCNYSKGKFNNEITCIVPSWCSIEELNKYGEYHTVDRNNTPESIFMASLNNDERCYFLLLDKGWKPQQARQVLPTALKTELFMCGFASDWEKFFKLRDAGSAHPDAQYLAKPLHEEFINRKYI